MIIAKKHRFQLAPSFLNKLRERPTSWGYGALSEFVYYSRYSRMKDDGSRESWMDVVVRVVEGCMSIRKWWYSERSIDWDGSYWQDVAQDMALAIYDMRFLPAGRGLWAMGTEYVYERGSMALNNCAFVDVTDDLAASARWLMDALMCGVGVGFSTQRTKPWDAVTTRGWHPIVHSIDDSREGWADSVKALIESYDVASCGEIVFDYSKVRPAGSPIRGFGGTTSGPAPLRKLHRRIRALLEAYSRDLITRTRLTVDVMNAIGACVVAGNIRRSAEIATGSLDDEEFMQLKQYSADRFGASMRRNLGWMSNNSVELSHPSDFDRLHEIANLVRYNGEPGVYNLINIQKYARIHRKKADRAIGLNPCAEIPLESYELCNLVETFPTRCKSRREFLRTLWLATLYACTVSLLPTHSEETNEVVARNRRIGVSVSGIAQLVDKMGMAHVIRLLRDGYEKVVEPAATLFNLEAEVPTPVRLTTVKPSGTVSLLAGVSPGMHWPSFEYGIRRVRLSDQASYVQALLDAGIPCEKDKQSDNTLVFEFPMHFGSARPAARVSVWQKAAMAAMLNLEWADNAVSNTITFRRDEAHDVEQVMATFAPLVKSMSMLPDASEGAAYEQMPEEPVSKEEFEKRAASLKPMTLRLVAEDSVADKYCDSESCELDFGRTA